MGSRVCMIHTLKITKTPKQKAGAKNGPLSSLWKSANLWKSVFPTSKNNDISHDIDYQKSWRFMMHCWHDWSNKNQFIAFNIDLHLFCKMKCSALQAVKHLSMSKNACFWHQSPHDWGAVGLYLTTSKTAILKLKVCILICQFVAKLQWCLIKNICKSDKLQILSDILPSKDFSLCFYYTPVWKTGRIMPWQCLSVRPSVRPSVRVFRTFLQHALRYQFETWYIHSVGGTTCRVWVASQLGHFDLVYSQK